MSVSNEKSLYFLTSPGQQTFLQRRTQTSSFIQVSIESELPFLKSEGIVFLSYKKFVNQVQSFLGCQANFRVIGQATNLGRKEYLYRCKGSRKDFFGEDSFEVRLIVNPSRIFVEYTITSGAVFCGLFSEVEFLNTLLRVLSTMTDYVQVTDARALIPI